MGTDQASHTRSPPEGSRQQEETVRDGRRGPLAEADAEPIGTWLPTCSMLHVGFRVSPDPSEGAGFGAVDDQRASQAVDPRDFRRCSTRSSPLSPRKLLDNSERVHG